jgi:hypothetical protein
LSQPIGVAVDDEEIRADALKKLENEILEEEGEERGRV